MTDSKKHHYIPRFYLKGFTDSQNKFYIYDKLTRKTWLSNPDNSFAENHRNTGIIVDKRTSDIIYSDLAEKMLSYFDSRSAKAIADIRNSTPSDPILTIERLYAIRFFIISTFWRSPANDSLRLKIINNFSFEDLGFGIFNQKTGERSLEIENTVKDIDLWRKTYPILLTTTSFTDKFVKLNSDDWRLYYRSNDFHITTDNPIIFDQYENFSSLHNELIFPLSSRNLVVSSKKFKPKILAPVFNLKVDLLLFYYAKRFVASSNKEYLLLLAEQSNNNLTKPSWAKKFKEEIFNHFY